jgi:hypothetical protein
MDVVLKDEVRTARKMYPCDAYRWWRVCNFGEHDLSADQKLMLAGIEAQRGRIMRGARYRYQRGIFEGRMVTWRERLDMGAICRDIGLYSVRT